MVQATECMAPIIIHQVGKVASQTIERTLRRALPNAPIFRTHILSKQGCDSFRKRLETLLKLEDPQKHQESWLRQIQHGEQLRRQVERYKKLVDENFVKQKVTVVTLTREPVAVAIAAFFQSLTLFFPNIESRCEKEPVNKLVAEVTDYYLDCVRSFLGQQAAKHDLGSLHFHTIRSLVSGFFDEEIKPVFEIDIFAAPFDPNRGYQIYQGKYARVLLIRLENLNEVVHKAFREFLGLEELKLVNDNQASQKFYKDIYSEFKDTICLPEAFVDLHYDCKFARHFYSPQELAAFRKKWVNSHKLNNTLASEQKNKFQLSLLEKYTGELREQLYSLDFPLKGLCDGKAVMKRVIQQQAKKRDTEIMNDAMLKQHLVVNIPGMKPVLLVAYYDELVDIYSNAEMETKAWFVEHVKPDWNILDCGAHVGYYTVMFARLVPQGRVYAFEPTETINMLARNIENNNVSNNVELIKQALGNKIGPKKDKVFRIWGNDPDEMVYDFNTIDNFVAERGIRVDAIKIDVDSFDFEVLQGAKETMRSQNPFIMVEVNYALRKRNQYETDVLRWMAEQGYVHTRIFDGENFLFKVNENEVKLSPRYRFSPTLTLDFTKTGAEESIEHEKQYGCNILQPATRQFTCHGQTPQPTFGQQESVGIACATEPKILVEPQQKSSITIPSVYIQRLHEELDFARPIYYPQSSLNKPLEQWKMEVDDAPIFRYIYHNFRPRRHLEFGTWQGAGTLYCLEECDATVWSINLLEGEVSKDGAVSYRVDDNERASAQEWARKMGLEVKDWPQTDSLGYIGRFYLEKGLGSRVCQIYGDSTKWDISNYPPGFFDTALIDGGHQKDVVINDTAKAFKLLRSDGLIMWHDFCPPIYDKFETTLGVMRAIHQQWEWINEQILKLFWIYPSWILVGVKK